MPPKGTGIRPKRLPGRLRFSTAARVYAFRAARTAARPAARAAVRPSAAGIAVVLSIVAATSLFAWTSSRYYNLDTVDPLTPKVTCPKKLTHSGVTQLETNQIPQPSPTLPKKDSGLLLNEVQVSNKLREFEESFIVHRNNGVVRYDVSQLASNCPIEDDRDEDIVLVPILHDNNIKTNTDWMFFSVFDGHGGWTTSSRLRSQLIPCIISELSSIFKPVSSDDLLRYVPNSATIDQAIKNGFLKLDHEIVNNNIERLLNDSNKSKAAELLMPALLGLCALLSFYDTDSKILKVALTGDSRALLGSLRDNRWTVRQLSIDQTGANPTEVARIISEHPNEPNVIKNGRVLGSLEPTRAFGDCRYKLPASIQERIYQQFFGRRLPNHLKLPPYVTAEPVISSTKICPEQHDFLVMASDGLYEMLTNEEIVGLVVKWMEKEKFIKPQTSFWNVFGSVENKLPPVVDCTTDKLSKQPFRHKRGPGPMSYLLEDKNVLTHLIRNALSQGGLREQTSMLISIPNPVSRRYRDDLTVTVVFFGNANDAKHPGSIELNETATRGGKGPLPKL